MLSSLMSSATEPLKTTGTTTVGSLSADNRVLEDVAETKFSLSETPITMLMCDLVDSTTLATSMSAEDLGALLTDYYATCLIEIQKWGGQLIQLMGDGLLVLFDGGGRPRVAAIHAIRAGLGLRVQVSQVGNSLRSSGTPLAVRIAIASGQGISTRVRGSIGDGYHDVVFGQLPFLVDLLKGSIEPNGIVVNERTAHLVDGRCCLERLAALSIKDVPESVVAWRVIEQSGA